MLALIIFSPTRLSPLEKEILRCIDMKVNTETFDSVYVNGNKISYKEFRKKNNFLSLIYLSDDCDICYERFNKWQSNVNKITGNLNYTSLFVIHGRNQFEFLRKAISWKNVSTHCNMVIDSSLNFILLNDKIPYKFFENSVLIDTNDRIRLIGEPFSSKEMELQFVKICSVKDL